MVTLQVNVHEYEPANVLVNDFLSLIMRRPSRGGEEFNIGGAMLCYNPYIDDDRILVVETAEEYTAVVFQIGKDLGSPEVLRLRDLDENAVKGKDVEFINIDFDSIPAAIIAAARSVRCETVKL